MKKKTIKKRILAGLLVFSLIVPANVAGAKTQTVLETNVTEASEGCTLVGVYGSYFAQAEEALAKINEIRKEACEAGNIRDPRDSGRYLQPSDYVPLKWSSDLEYIARIRAAEAGIAFRFMDSGHDRLNEKDTFSIGSNGISSSSEDLAYYYVKDMIEGILLWYSEKQYWVKQDFSEETGHYKSMINPKYTYVGFGGFYSEAAPYPATMAGEFSTESDLDETIMEAPEDVMQKIEVSNDYIQETYLDGDDQIFTNGTTTVTPRVKLRRNNAIRNVWSMEDVTYTSSDPAVATVTQDGLVTGITNGTVTITAKSGDTIVAQKEITVKCNHPRKMTLYTESTCTKEGKKQYYCAICQNTIEEVVAKKAHDYVYGEADSEGKSTGKCSVCGDTIRITPPTNMKLYWRNSTSSISSYSTVFPTSNPVGSLLYCWIQASDGDPDYQDMVMESTNEEVAAVPEKASNNAPYDHFEILAEGITKLSVYPKYNPRIKQTFMLRVGGEGSQDISDMDVSLSKDAFIYDGNACKPEVTVSYRKDTVLEQGIDYTISYEKNVNAGTATAVISGKGLFYGKIRKDFTIQKTGEESHIHEVVIDEAVAATCTRDGVTEGRHCSKCGEVLEEQTVIPALGHKYAGGTCERCGDILYIEIDGVRYTKEEDLSGNVTIHVCAKPGEKISGKVNIPAEVAMGDMAYTVTVIDANAFADQTELTYVTLPKTITNIGNKAFAGCTALEGMKFKAKIAPEAAEDAWKGAGTEDFTILTPKNARDYYNIEKISGATIRPETDAEHEHDMQKFEAKAPTCTQPGNIEYYICRDCDKVYADAAGKRGILLIDTYLQPLGHDWESDFTIDIPATATTQGEKSIHCRRCGERSHIVKYSLEDEKNSSNDNSSSAGKSEQKNLYYEGSNENEDTEYGRKITYSYLLKGSLFKAKGLRYRVNAVNTKKGIFDVTCMGSNSKKIKKITVPNYVKYKGIHYRVTGIGKNAFAGCRKVKTVKIQSMYLKKKNIGKNAFRGIPRKASVYVPLRKMKSYRKWLKKAGLKCQGGKKWKR